MTKRITVRFLAGLAVACQVSSVAAVEPASPGVTAANDMGDLAAKLNNPAASLISLPLQNNFDFGAGPDGDGFQYRLNIQPVVPFKLNEDWKILSRTIVPFIHQENIIPGDSSQTGLGDSTVTLWVSPEKKEEGKPTWGLGPVFQFPTATDEFLGSGKWGIGPSALLVYQAHGWTTGFLANHLWSFAGPDSREDLCASFLQPFLSYQTKTHTTFGINTESSYDWEQEQWTVPINAFVTQLVKIGTMPISFQVGGRYYAEKPENGPEWGLRFSMTLVFPEK